MLQANTHKILALWLLAEQVLWCFVMRYNYTVLLVELALCFVMLIAAAIVFTE